MTPGYSPPEQYGTARTDVRTDIYSLGATLYAGLTGVIPEDGLARAMDNAQLTALRKRNPKVTRRLAAAIEKAMAVDPGDRFQSAEEFKIALLSARRGRSVPQANLRSRPRPESLNTTIPGRRDQTRPNTKRQQHFTAGLCGGREEGFRSTSQAASPQPDLAALSFHYADRMRRDSDPVSERSIPEHTGGHAVS